MTTTFETTSIGDRVWCITLGWGTITQTLYEGEQIFPIIIEFDSGRRISFTEKGLLYSDDIHQTLFWDEIEIKAPTKPLPKLNKDDCVEVWNTDTVDPAITYRRHFSHFKDGRIFCFNTGGTSWTSNQTSDWAYWRKPE